MPTQPFVTAAHNGISIPVTDIDGSRSKLLCYIYDQTRIHFGSSFAYAVYIYCRPSSKLHDADSHY